MVTRLWRTVMKNPLTIDEVVEIANISKPTVYRKVKNGDFPQPNKVPRPTNRGPEKVNRWEHDDVVAWAIENGKAEAEDAINLGIIDEPASTSFDYVAFFQKHKAIITPMIAGALAAILWSAYYG